MINPDILRYLSSYTSLMRESTQYRKDAEKAFREGDLSAWSYYLINAQSAMDEATRRLDIQHGIDHGQVQRNWISVIGEVTPLL